MKQLCLLFGLFCTANSVLGQKNSTTQYAFERKLTSKVSLVFLQYDKLNNLYKSPRLLQNKVIRKINNYNEENFSGIQIKISHDKEYIVMDNIVKGYIASSKDSVLYENYHCVIIRISDASVVKFMQSGCGGQWNRKNQWIFDNAILFEANDYSGIKKK